MTAPVATLIAYGAIAAVSLFLWLRWLHRYRRALERDNARLRRMLEELERRHPPARRGDR